MYTLEQRAETVAEYLLTGSVSHAARFLGVQRKTARGWIRAAENPLPDHEENALGDRARQIAALKRASLDLLIERTIELQMRDLPDADFRDRTGLLKIASEQRQLAKGLPTSITKSVDVMDSEIERMLGEMAERETAASGDGDRAD